MFRHIVGRRGLTGEDIHPRHPLRLWIGLDPVVAGDDVQDIHQLAFIFVDAFNLYIKQRPGIDHHVQLLGDIVRQPLLILKLGAAHRLVHRRVINMLQQIAQLA